MIAHRSRSPGSHRGVMLLRGPAQCSGDRPTPGTPAHMNLEYPCSLPTSTPATRQGRGGPAGLHARARGTGSERDVRSDPARARRAVALGAIAMLYAWFLWRAFTRLGK